MTPDRWQQVSELFEAAIEKDPSVRNGFIATSCSHDPGLARELESLLKEHDRAGDFLNEPASAEAASALRQTSNDSHHDPYLGLVLNHRYRIESRLACGGQALVYLARDETVMSRLVVIKILHAAGHNTWLRQKFMQEMEALSRIDHPAIVGVLDTGELPDGTPFLVVQFVDGLTLRQELDKGPLSPVRAAAILRQIGQALGATHAVGIAHGDLKPENIMLQRLSDESEFVKLIDFGIAEMGGQTTTMVAGTARYMAPEQKQGQSSPASDIYAFGLIACEALSGQPDLQALKTSDKVRRQILSALAHDPKDRPQRANDFGNRLAETLLETSKGQPEVQTRQLRRIYLRWLTAAIVLAILGTVYMRGRTPEAAVTLSLTPPEATTFGGFELSPDGHRIVLVATNADGKTQLWVRPLASLNYQPLAGTEGADYPFWSPDSRSIAFFADARMKKIDAMSGSPVTICNVEIGSQGGAWSRDDEILFTLNPGTALYRVSAVGGEPRLATALDSEHGETAHSWPQFLPDGDHFLYLSQSAHPNGSAIYVASLSSTIRKRLLFADSSALYASGYLLWQREQTLMAQPFDASLLQLTGEPISVAEKVGAINPMSRPFFSVSENGVLAYDARNPEATQLLWLDRAGRNVGSVASGSGEGIAYSNVNLSPDGTWLAVDRRGPQNSNRDIWIFDLIHGGESRLTFDAATDASPVWSPDARQVAFFSTREGKWNLYVKPAAGAANDQLLLKSDENKISCDWSGNGYILYSQWDPRTRWDLWVLPTEGERTPQLVVQTTGEESCGHFSPDGRWLAYVSNVSGRDEVYIEAFPPDSGQTGGWQLSVSGGSVPRWRRDGKELFYLTADQRIMAVAISNGAEFPTGDARPLFQTQSAGFLRYDVTADGKRFLVNTALMAPRSSLPTVVINWPAAISR